MLRSSGASSFLEKQSLMEMGPNDHKLRPQPMAELNRSMQLPGKRKSPPETSLNGSVFDAPNKEAAKLQNRPWLQQSSPASNGILHIPTNMLSPKTLQSLMHGKKVMPMESSTPQKSGNHLVNKKQPIPPRGSMKAKDDVNESVRAKMKESLAAALALVQQPDESPKGKENSESKETPAVNLESTQSFQPASHPSISVPVSEETMSELPTGVESSVQKDSEISVDIKMEDANGLNKSQYDEVFPRDNVPFTDIIFSNDDLLQGNELSWVLEHVSDLGETKNYGTNGEKSLQDPEILASKIEMELFKLFGGVNKKYRERGRSLLFNLKDKNNPELRERVMSEEISAERLCSMTAEELASKELSQWRQEKAEKMAEMVVLRDTDVDVRSLVRKTHKGEFQVEIDPMESGTVDVSAGITSRTRRRPKAKTTLKDKTEKSDQTKSGATPPSTEEMDPMEGLAMDDEMKDAAFLPPIVSLDEFMESLDSEPPFESPRGNSEKQVSVSALEKSNSEARSHSKSPKGSPKEPSDKNSPEPKSEKIDEVSPKSDASVKLDDNDVSRLEKTSSSLAGGVKGERIWDGILQLSMSSVVPVTGIFKSGEKAEANEWPAMVEVKGRVRLNGFKKFIEELPKSRTRALMVMYLLCKDGISESQRGSLVEVVDSYVADQRVGYAEPASGVELYLCPTRGESLDLLSKVISKDQFDEVKCLDVGLIGVVVWRRAFVPKPVSKRHHYSSSSFSGSRNSVLPENKKQRVHHLTEKPVENHHYHGYGGKTVEADDDDDDLPPGFGPVASKDDDDLPEFNFSSSSVGPVSSLQPLPTQSKSMDQVRKLIHKYGNSANIYDDNHDDDDDDDIPEWQPNNHQVPSHQLPPPPPLPGFRPEMVRPPPAQDGWWDNHQSGGGSYDRNRSRNRGF